MNITHWVRISFQVLCYHYWQTNIQACLDDPKILKLDVQKCWRLDFAGRPISEYDVPDNYIACVGYWMEDTKSYLITYDREDPVCLMLSAEEAYGGISKKIKAIY